MQHHVDAVARFVTRLRARPEVLGALLTGSVARGEERFDSDVDLVVVVTDEEWSRAVEERRVMVVETEDVGYDGGYYDVKLATLGMLRLAPTAGDDPVRHSLGTARCVHDRGVGIESLLDAIRTAATRPSAELAAAFLAQARLHGEYFLPEGVRAGDLLLVSHAAIHLATSAARALLALDGVAYPGPKQLLRAVRNLPSAPAGFTDALLALLEHPSPGAADHLLALLEEVAGDALAPADSLARFVLDNELAWFTGRAAPEYR